MKDMSMLILEYTLLITLGLVQAGLVVLAWYGLDCLPSGILPPERPLF